MAFCPAYILQSAWPLKAHSTVPRAGLSPSMVLRTLSVSRRLSSPFLFSAQYNSRRSYGNFASSTIRSPVSSKVNEGAETKDHPRATFDDNKVKLYFLFSLVHYLYLIIFKCSFL